MDWPVPFTGKSRLKVHTEVLRRPVGEAPMKAPAGSTAMSRASTEELLHAAFAASPLPAVLTDGPEHHVVQVNDAYLVEFGSCALRRPAAESLPELASVGLEAALHEVAARGHAVSLDDRLVRRRGGDCYYSLICVPAQSGVLVVCQDVTARVLRESTLLEEDASNRHLAVALQRALLPHRIIQPDELRLAACYLPALVRYDTPGSMTGADEPVLEVGGDWYDAIPLGAGRTGLVIGGVAPIAGGDAGGGVHAAAVMGRLRAAVRAYASQNLPPGEVMYHLDRHALELDGERPGAPIATLVYAVHDADSGSLTYANAGHLPPLLRLPDGYVDVLDGASGPSLGTGEWTWQEAAVAVPPGSYLAFYTQGLVERSTGDIRRIFGRAPDEEPRRPGAGPVDLVRDHILGSIDPASVSSGQHDPHRRGRTDDVALLVAHAPKWSGPHATLFRSAAVELVGGPEVAAHARAFTYGVLASWQVGEQITDTGVLAVSELVANAVMHGRPPVSLRLRRTDRRLIIDVSDTSDHLPRRRLARETDEDGRGIGIIAALASSWGSRPLPDGKSVWCEFEL
jgi:serine phosphatase RsbU (regulator of sigma subunit)/anti-sigma regulatory factor (Ser/Thr protein kinase)